MHERTHEGLVVTGTDPSARKVKAIEQTGARVLRLSVRGKGIPFASLLKALGRMGLLSVMIEGGAAVAARALAEGTVHKVHLFYGPKIIGGDGRSMVDSLGIRSMKRCKTISDVEITRFGQDLMVTGYLKK